MRRRQAQAQGRRRARHRQKGAEAEASISVGATGWSCEFRAARSRSRSRTRPSAVPAAMAVARPSAGPTREARPPTPPICGCLVPAWIIARRSSDYIAGSDAPWIRAGIHVTDYHRKVPFASRARPHPHDARARPHFGHPDHAAVECAVRGELLIRPQSSRARVPAKIPGLSGVVALSLL